MDVDNINIHSVVTKCIKTSFHIPQCKLAWSPLLPLLPPQLLLPPPPPPQPPPPPPPSLFRVHN